MVAPRDCPSPLRCLLLLLTGTTEIRSKATDGTRLANPLWACQYQPSFSAALTMECDFSGYSESDIPIESGMIPSSLQSIHIRKGGTTKIAEDVFSDLPNLQTIHLEDIALLRIARSNYSRVEDSGQVTITVLRVSTLLLDAEAFSGWSPPGPGIVIQNVSRCDVSANAFAPDSTIQSVALQGIRSLRPTSYGFRANIGRLQLQNVTLDQGCQNFSFSGRVGNMTLQSVNATAIEGWCFHAMEGWGGLTFRSNDIQDIRPFGIKGKIDHIVIDRSRFGIVNRSGVHLDTITFTVTSTAFQEMKRNALDVRFKQFALLQESTIGLLCEGAFRQLEARTGGSAALIVRRVSVDTVEDGGLAFSEQTHLSLLDFELREPCACHADNRSLRLVIGGGAATDNITDNQRRQARQVDIQVRCLSGVTTPTLAQFRCKNCSAHGLAPAGCPPAVGRHWAWPVGSVGTLLLLVAVLALLAFCAFRTRKRRQACGQPETYPGKSRAHDSDDQDVSAEPMYEEVPPNVHLEVTPRPVQTSMSLTENVHYNARSITSTAGSSYTDHIYSRPAEPVYSEILPRPPSALYMELQHYDALRRPSRCVYQRHGEREKVGTMSSSYATIKGENHSDTEQPVYDTLQHDR